MAKPKKYNDADLPAILLREVVLRILERKGQFKAKTSPFTQRQIVEFKKRMRVSSFDKFDNTTYISYINFYTQGDSFERDEPLGTLVIYVEEDFLVSLMDRMDYPIDNEDDPDEMEDACGTLCNLIAGNFKSGLAKLGYAEIEMSHFFSFCNEVLNGVEYNTDLKVKHEIPFIINKSIRLVVDLAIAPVPRYTH
ncbi:MAG: chemotaxis protein CheX [Candidatus Omnitrophica bacterium]|nr:chemotaxis protein CheX [Candidatus Omnitrophota bacterium]